MQYIFYNFAKHLERRTIMEQAEGRKNDRADGKLRWELLPLDLMEKVVEVYDFGAKKYAPETWKQLADGENRYRAALLRHLTAHYKGELRDPESGLLHTQHLAWNAIALLYFAMEKEGCGESAVQ